MLTFAARALQLNTVLQEGPPDRATNPWNVVAPMVGPLLWFVFALVVLLVFRSVLHDLLTSLLWRVRCGTPLKIGSFELGGAYVSPGGDISQDGGHIERATRQIDA